VAKKKDEPQIDWEKVIPEGEPLPTREPAPSGDPEPGDDAARSVPDAEDIPEAPPPAPRSELEVSEGTSTSEVPEGTPEVTIERVPPEAEDARSETGKPRRRRRRRSEEAGEASVPPSPERQMLLPVTDMAGVIVTSESAAIASVGLDPLNEMEQQALRGAWAAYLESRGQPMTPEALLALTHALVMVPRIPQVIKRFGG